MALKISKLLFLLTPVASMLLVGCHCVEFSERYGDRIDRIADRQLTLDRFYRPGLDLTRICHDCKKQDARCHRPVMYPDSRIPQQAPVEPTLPAVPPAEPINIPEPNEPNLIPPVPPAIQPIESAAVSGDWQGAKTIMSAAINVGATPFMLPKNQSEEEASEPGIELTTAKKTTEWAQPVETPSQPVEIERSQPFPLLLEPESIQELAPRRAEAISAPAGVLPSQQYLRSLKAQE